MIEFEDLDKGYDELESMHSTVKTKGEKLVQEMGITIGDLIKCWIGSDATKHINNLIVVRNALQELVGEIKKTTANAAEEVINVQTVRSSNAPGSGEVGGSLEKTTAEFEVIKEVGDTRAYSADKAKIEAAHANLESECSSFESFVSEISEQQSTLFKNWKSGANREGAVDAFKKFEEHSEEYKKFMNDAKDNLGIAKGNIAKLQ